MNVNDFTYTVTSPLGRRLPLGDHPLLARPFLLAGWALALVSVGAAGAWLAARRA